MPERAVRLLEEADGVRAALSPLRRAALEHLWEPASATEIALALGVPRQQGELPVRALEKAGLVELVEERRRRGCTERALPATAPVFLVDPEVLGPSRTAIPGGGRGVSGAGAAAGCQAAEGKET